MPLLKDPAKATGRILPTLFDQGNVSLRTDRFRYVRYEDGSEELYDLKKDPNEWDNLSADPEQREILERLGREVARYRPDERSR